MNNNLVIHVNSNDPEVLKLAFTQAANYRRETLLKHHKISPQEIAIKAALEHLTDEELPFNQIMVANGPAVQHFVKKNKELMAIAENAVAHGLKIHVGNYAMDSYQVTKDMLWPFVEVVPSATLDIVHLQEAGFAYMKV